MKQIKSSDTKPEKIVRSFLHKNGYRFRLQGKVSKKQYLRGVLPGKPDIVLAKHKAVIFIHGCFWHHHKNCSRATTPKSNTDYWVKKIQNNINRDISNRQKLTDLGWNVIVVWECQINSSSYKNTLFHRLKKEKIDME